MNPRDSKVKSIVESAADRLSNAEHVDHDFELTITDPPYPEHHSLKHPLLVALEESLWTCYPPTSIKERSHDRLREMAVMAERRLDYARHHYEERCELRRRGGGSDMRRLCEARHWMQVAMIEAFELNQRVRRLPRPKPRTVTNGYMSTGRTVRIDGLRYPLVESIRRTTPNVRA